MNALLERHPYIAARLAFMAGEIPTVQAIGMCARDRDFIAEAQLDGLDVVAAAREIVLEVWSRELAFSMAGSTAR